MKKHTVVVSMLAASALAMSAATVCAADLADHAVEPLSDPGSPVAEVQPPNTKGAVNVTKEPSPKRAMYAVTVRRGKSVSVLFIASRIGAVAMSQVRAGGPDTKCTFKNALGTSELWVSHGGEVSLTIVPAEEKDGAVATIVSLNTSQTPNTTTKLVGGCLLFAGSTSAESLIDAATLRVGQVMNARFGDAQVNVRLTSLDD